MFLLPSQRGGWSRDRRDGTSDDTDDEALRHKEGGGGRIEAGDRGSDNGVPTCVMIVSFSKKLPAY